jgi:hypothetical protein
MRIINLKDTINQPGEYIVGVEQTHSHTCYFIYGTLKPEETRVLSPGHGHEEIFCCLEGEIIAKSEESEDRISKGQCFHLSGDEAVEISNGGKGIVIYAMAGGHSDKSHHGGGSH